MKYRGRFPFVLLKFHSQLLHEADLANCIARSQFVGGNASVRVEAASGEFIAVKDGHFIAKFSKLRGASE